MKKKKETVQKPKEFASRPFGTLKGVRAEQAEVRPKVAVPAPEPALTSDDSEVFLRAMAGVKRVHTPPAPRKGEKPVPRKPPAVSDEDRRTFLEALGKLHLDVSFRDEHPAEVEPVRPLPVNRLRELKRGTMRIDLQLDLHGLTREEAVQSMAAFVSAAYNRGQKAVLVITGKGNNSPGEPVLQGAVTGWLREKGKGMVAEFAPAPREMGGSGAFVVFLKKRDEVQRPGTRD